MSENEDIFITHEERDPERLENILRHSARRDEVPVMLVQLPNLMEKTESEFPAARRRATIVNTATTPQVNLERDVDPVEWHFRQNTLDLRTSLLREAAVDELSSRRKSRVGNAQTDQVVMMASNCNIRYPIKFGVEDGTNEARSFSTIKRASVLEDRTNSKRSDVNEQVSSTVTVYTDPGNDNDTVVTNKAKVTSEVEDQENRESPTVPASGVEKSVVRFKDSNLEIETRYDENQNDKDRGVLNKLKLPSDEDRAVIDDIMYSINAANSENEEVIGSEEESLKSEKSSPKGSKKGEFMNNGNEITVLPAQFSFSGQQSPFKEIGNEITVPVDTGKKLSSKKNRDEIVVMPAQFSFTEQKSPFKKTRDEIRPRPSSRVRVLIMLDEWGEPSYYLDEEDGKRRLADGDGRRRDPYEDDDDGSGKYPKKETGKKKSRKGGPWDDDDLDQSQRARKPGDKKRGKSSRGNRPGDRDYDDPRYGRGKDGSRLGKGWDDDDDKSKRGKRPGDRRGRDDDVGEKSKRGKRFGNRGWREDDDDNDESKRGKRPGDRRFSDPKYRRGKDGTRPGKGWDDDDDIRRGNKGGIDDEDDDKKGRRPKDDVYRKYDDGTGPKGTRKGKPGGETDPVKYRMVTMPRSATMLTSRRRYHVQIIDHEMKEPWFNSCFNISKENNVDFNYEGPVKITPYYVGDKFS